MDKVVIDFNQKLEQKRNAQKGWANLEVWLRRGVVQLTGEKPDPTKGPIMVWLAMMGGTDHPNNLEHLLGVSADVTQAGTLLGSYRGLFYGLQLDLMSGTPGVPSREEKTWGMGRLEGIEEVNNSFDYFQAKLRESSGEIPFIVVESIPKNGIPMLHIKNPWLKAPLKYGLTLTHVAEVVDVYNFSSMMLGMGYDPSADFF